MADTKDSNTDFAKEVRDAWKSAEEADSDNRKEAIEDQKFVAGDQWDSQVRQFRETPTASRPFPLPCLTINTLPQFVGQVIGDRRANATAIKVLPREDGDVKIAEVRSELIRSIELQSKADRVRAIAFEQQVSCGIGNTRIDLDWAYEDAFDRDLFIRSIPNPLAVLWDPMAAEPTGRDAKYCFVVDTMTKDSFKAQFGDKATESTQFEAAGLKAEGWMAGETVRVAEYWKIDERLRTIAFMNDGTTQDVTDMPRENWLPNVFIKEDGQPLVREKAKCKYAVRHLTNGVDELEEKFEVKLYRVPIVRWSGREIYVENKRVRYGLTRFARDPQRLKNYWRSVIAELLMGAQRANYVSSAAAIKGRERDWPNTQVYNDGQQPPTEITGNNLAAILNEAQMCAQDMKDTTGLHDASLGIQSNETSGKAIQARQHEGDIATIIYHDNANAAMQEEGEVLNALVPMVYDTARTLRTVGENEAVKLIRVNDPNFQPTNLIKENVDLGKGRYDVTISTGPAYMTKRQQATDALLQLASQAPQIAQAAPDIIVKAMDIPDGDILAERLKRTVPPQILGDDEKDDQADQDPQAQQAKAEALQQAQQMQQLQLQSAEADTRLKVAQADKAEAEAQKAKAEALQIQVEMGIKGGVLANLAAEHDEIELGEAA